MDSGNIPKVLVAALADDGERSSVQRERLIARDLRPGGMPALA